MNLKNAIAVCLISLFSATLVVLIARMLDSQAASQLEPQLASIVEELRAIRKQGGAARTPDAASPSESVGDGLVVYYFHSNFRCPTCRAVESQAKEAVEAGFAPQLNRSEITWKILNYEKPAGAELARKFEIKDPAIVVARVKDDRVRDWKRLDKVLALVDDKAAFAKYLRDEIEQMLAPEKRAGETTSKVDVPTIPVPAADDARGTAAKGRPAIPIPE